MSTTRLSVLNMKMVAQSQVFPHQQFRGYYKDNVIMEREYGEGYMADPVDTAERIVRCLALHDNINDPSNITLGQSFEDLGLNQLDMVEIFLAIEKDFDFEISEDACESFTTVNDLVEHVARNFYAKWKLIRNQSNWNGMQKVLQREF